MSVRASQWAWEQGKRHQLNTGELLLLVRIADHADNDGVCWPGVKGLAEHCVCDEATVRRRLRRLENRGLIYRQRRKLEQGRGRRNDVIGLQMDGQDQPGKTPAKSETTNRAPAPGPSGHFGVALYRGTTSEPTTPPLAPPQAGGKVAA